MKRQLRKVIFLPANEMTLSYSGHSYKPQYQTFKTRDSYFKSRWNKFIKKQSFREFEISQLSVFEISSPENIWDAIAYCQTCGYQVILYPELNSNFDNPEIREAFEKLKTKKLVDAMLDGNAKEDFLKAIKSFDINPHNSIFVSREYELIEPLFEEFHPLNSYYSGEVFDKQLGFYFIYWNQSQNINDKFLIKSNGSENLSLKLTQSFPLNKWVHSAIGFPFLIDKIVFIYEGSDESIHLFITENHAWIQQLAENKGCTFIYFPEFIKNKASSSFISEYIQYYYPGASIDSIPRMDSLLSKVTPAEIQNVFLSISNMPDFNSPSLLRNQGSVEGSLDNEFSLFTFDQNKTIKEQFETYFRFLRPANDNSRIFYSLAKNQNETADDKFNNEANKLTEDIIQKIEYLKANGMHSLLAEIALRIYNSNDQLTLNASTKAGNKLEIMADVSPVISRLRIEWVSKYDFQILLPDYGNMVVDMPRLPKALYYFFLKHPEGVLLNSLADYKDELRSIYQRISNKGDKEEIIKNIDRLVDPLDNSVNVNCSRIKSAFVKLIDDRMAKHYYITGWRGQVKKVTLSTELIEIIHLF